TRARACLKRSSCGSAGSLLSLPMSLHIEIAGRCRLLRQLDEALSERVLASSRRCQLDNRVVTEAVAHIRLTAEQLREPGDGGGKAHVRTRIRELAHRIRSRDRTLDRSALAFARQLVTDAQIGDLRRPALGRPGLRRVTQWLEQASVAARRHVLIEGGHAVPGADLARVDGVIREVLPSQQPGLVSD